MVELTRIPGLIAARGEQGRELRSLAESPVARTALRLLATRTNLEVFEELEGPSFDFCKMRDISTAAFPFRSPFAAVCVDNSAVTSQTAAQELLEVVRGYLTENDLHYNPAILIHTAPLGPLEPLLEFSTTPFAPLSQEAFLELLLARPPRVQLLRLVRGIVPLRHLNPYVYKGPIGPYLFKGRHGELDRLAELHRSYALVGPRAIGKTSLMNRAYEHLVESGEIAIRVEHSPGMSEIDFCKAIIERFIQDYGAADVLRNRPSPNQVERLIRDFSVFHVGGSARRGGRFNRVAILIDEADELTTRCENLVAVFRRCHNSNVARFVFLGYKHLRKALNDQRCLQLSNIAHEMSLSKLDPRETGQLIVEPMADLGITPDDTERVVSSIHRQTGGSPSRIQLLCFHLVNSLNGAQRRVLMHSDVAQAMTLPPIRRHLFDWLTESTTLKERWLAELIALLSPCSSAEVVERARQCSPLLSDHVVQAEILDLAAADILDFQQDGRLDFSFPAMKQLVHPHADWGVAFEGLKRRAIDIFGGESA